MKIKTTDIDTSGTADNSTFLRGDGQWEVPPGTATGTVTSVGVSVPTGFSASGSPVTTSGTIAISYDTGFQGYTSAEALKLSGIAEGATDNLGTVTSVSASGGSTGLSFSGSPIVSSGGFTLEGTLSVSSGGTGTTSLRGVVMGSGTAALTASRAVTNCYFALPGEGIKDLGMTGLYDRNVLTHAAYYGNSVTINITGAGTYTNSVVNKNSLFNASGSFFTISSVDETTSKIEIIVELADNVATYGDAFWQPFIQYRFVNTAPPTYTYMEKITVHVSVDGVNWATHAGWTTSDLASNLAAPSLWVGEDRRPNDPFLISSWRFVRFTLENINIGGVNPDLLWISEIGLRHKSAPYAIQYLDRVEGGRIYSDVQLTSKTPSSASATGTAGTVTWDSDYIYVCTATNTWKRAALSTW